MPVATAVKHICECAHSSVSFYSLVGIFTTAYKFFPPFRTYVNPHPLTKKKNKKKNIQKYFRRPLQEGRMLHTISNAPVNSIRLLLPFFSPRIVFFTQHRMTYIRFVIGTQNG